MRNENVTEFERYLNARPLDVHTWSDHPEVNIFVNEIYLLLSSIKGNERINKKLLKVVLLDLYLAWCTDPELMIMFSRDNNSYRAKSRYNEIRISKKIKDIVDELINEGIIDQKIGFQDPETGVGFQTRLMASPSLKEKFNSARFHQFQFSDHEGRESIVLRDETKEAFEDYQDTEITNFSRSLLSDYNALLAKTHIDIFDLDKPVIEIGSGSKAMKLAINQQDKFVRRIFNNSRWDQGGRFYGGWWQRCPKTHRENIVFDGVATAEIDFSGIHIVILYAHEGINYWAEVNEDPYSIHGINDIDPDIDLRAAAKLLLLTAINAETPEKAFGAFRQQAGSGSPEKRLTNEQLNSMLNQLKRKHEPIAHKLASGAGIELMYLDSQITERLIERFTRHFQCPILTIHDSYIVPFGWDRILHREMQVAFEAATGVSQPVVEHTTEYYDVLQDEPDPRLVNSITEYPEWTPSKRHLKDYESFKAYKNKPDRELWVPTWTMVY